MLSVFITPWAKPTDCQRATAIAAGNYIPEPEVVFVGLCPVTAASAVGWRNRQLAYVFRLAAIIKVFKMAETQMALRNAHSHRAFLYRFADHRVTGHYRQRAWWEYSSACIASDARLSRMVRRSTARARRPS